MIVFALPYINHATDNKAKMTATVEESATTILCSCKQTRFDIQNPVYSEVKQKIPTTKSRADPVSQLDIEGLNITVTSAGKAGVKAKGKARAEGLEILSNATLKLKARLCYALVGRNGTGKSSKFIVDLTGLGHAMKSLDLGHSTDSSNSSPESCC